MMRKGLWHQLGDRSQLMAKEQLQYANGVGVILSPRDLSDQKAEEYSREYRSLGADVLFDPQFYVPHFPSGRHDTYGELMDFRVSVSRLAEHSTSEFRQLSTKLKILSQRFACTAIMSPAVAMQAGQPDQLRVNLSMLDAAQDAGGAIGLPVYGVIPVGESLALSESELSEVLSDFTTRSVDGWILMMDLGADGFCRNAQHLKALCRSILRLAQTGTPVMHGCAGPNCLPSLACGATAFGMTHSKNMWRLPLSRFEPSEGGGGGAAPVRVFSQTLWSNFVFPDELVQVPEQLRRTVLQPSKWLNIDPTAVEYFPGSISQWDAYKHLIFLVGMTYGNLVSQGSVSARFDAVARLLGSAKTLFDILCDHYDPKDFASIHHDVWIDTLRRMRIERKADFDYLDLLGS